MLVLGLCDDTKPQILHGELQHRLRAERFRIHCNRISVVRDPCISEACNKLGAIKIDAGEPTRVGRWGTAQLVPRSQ